MFKIVPKTNNLYEMSKEGIIRRIDGLECTLTSIKNEPGITLVIYNKERTVALEWLRLITHFEVDLPYKYFFNIYFKDTFKWKYSNAVNKTICFYGKHPEYKPGYRYIPEFIRYAISKDGIIIDTYNGNIVPIVNKGKKDYLKVYIQSPSRNKKYDVVLHRLVALAWVNNPDPMRYYLCNHLDGNKHNPYYTNLEWTNHSGNNQHAVNSDLRTQNIECKLRGITDGKVYEFKSINEARRHIGRLKDGGWLIGTFLRPQYLIEEKYEIRIKGDNRPWFYENKNNILPFGRYITKVTFPSGEIKEFYDVRDIRKELKVKMRSSVSIYTLVERVLRDNPELKIDIIDLYKTEIVQGYEISTGKIYESTNHYTMSKLINVSRTGIKAALVKGETYITHGYAFRYKTDKKWNTHFNEAVNKPKCILAINKDGKEYECNSKRDALRLTNVNRLAICRSLHNIPINSDWHFKYKF